MRLTTARHIRKVLFTLTRSTWSNLPGGRPDRLARGPLYYRILFSQGKEGRREREVTMYTTYTVYAVYPTVEAVRAPWF